MTYRLFLDTNVLLDSMLRNRPGFAAARRLTQEAAAGTALCSVSASSLSDAYYVSRRTLAEEQRRAWLAFFLDTCEVVAPDAEACRQALASDEPDFEDGLVRALAERAGADYIISRDARAFERSSVPRVSAAEFLALAEAQG